MRSARPCSSYAKVSWQATDSFTFNSITGWRDQDWLFLTDGDAQVGNQLLPGIIPEFLPLFHIFQDQAQEQWSQEFQGLGAIGNGIDYVAGLYYFHEENQQITENVILTPLGFNNYWDTSLTTDSYAIYGSFDFRLLDTLTLTAGGRYTNDDKDFDTKVFHFDGSPLVACLGPDGSIVDPENPGDPAKGSQLVLVEKPAGLMLLTSAPEEEEAAPEGPPPAEPTTSGLD
jgi:iron complex outermembrane receptor protein